MARILVTGGNGQLGMELRSLEGSHSDHPFLFTDLEELDLTNQDAVREAVGAFRPDWVVNCAAYTAVDRAETEKEQAFLVNGKAVGYLASACRQAGSNLIQISTDYVFDGLGDEPYREDHPVNPRSAYGLSKLEGEREFHSSGASGLIIRTSWLYSSHGHNFVRTILRKSVEADELKVVNDQVGSPTYAGDLASAILQIIGHQARTQGVGVYHYSNEGQCTWFDLAGAIISKTGAVCRVTPVPTSAYPTAAERPKYSVLDKSKIRKAYNLEIPSWQDGLDRCLKLLKES